MNKKIYQPEIKAWRAAVKDMIILCRKHNINIDAYPENRSFVFSNNSNIAGHPGFNSIGPDGVWFSGTDIIIPIEDFTDDE
jgi:hypothetical protein